MPQEYLVQLLPRPIRAPLGLQIKYKHSNFQNCIFDLVLRTCLIAEYKLARNKDKQLLCNINCQFEFLKYRSMREKCLPFTVMGFKNPLMYQEN